MTFFKLVSVNVRGIRDKNKRKKVFEWAKDKGGDVVLLQETYSSPDIEEIWKRDWKGEMFFSHGTSHSRGVLMLINPMLNIEIDQVVIDKEGRYIFLKGSLLDSKLLIGNVYCPTRDKVQKQVDFLEKMDEIISDLYASNYSLILGGDFNVILNAALDYMGPNLPLKTKFNNSLEMFLKKYKLLDIWRRVNIDKRQYTFKQKNPLVQTRLDYWFITDQFEELVQKCEILTSVTPDHSGISLELKQIKKDNYGGKSYWKFNNSLCSDKEFVDGMIKEIENIKKKWANEFQNKLVFWDFLKMKMREFARKYSQVKAKEKRISIAKIEREIRILEEDLLNATNTLLTIKQIEEKKDSLKELYKTSIQGLKVRSRSVWFEEGENNKDYFEQLLKSNKKKTVISELQVDKNIINDKNEILKAIKSFYEKLYSNLDVTPEMNLEGSNFQKNIPRLSEESRIACEGKITIEEGLAVLKTMKLNKSPGNDGLSAEFYTTFWFQIGKDLVEALNEAYERGNLTASQKQGVITLIEKDGKDPLYIKNYRPITLLNVDYKILSKILANRMKTVLSEIIHFDQVGYMENRNIGEAVRIIDDMIFHCLTNKFDCFMLAVDFEKAFDSVSHVFLSRVLQWFGFGPCFRSWVKTIYTDISSCVMNGGFSTGYFDVKRGVRQGDPLSPYLFLIVIETLAHALRNDENLKGIDFGKCEVKQILYADDMTIFLRDKDSVVSLQKLFQTFQEVSGLKVNLDKTKVMLIGKDRRDIEHLNFRNVVSEVKILGITFSLDNGIRIEQNYKEILSKIKRLLVWWKQRDLTMMGKIYLIKTYALSKLIYVVSSSAVPKWLLTEIHRICFDFIWNGKDRIKRAIMYQDYERGGLKMMNFELFVKAQRVTWVKRLLYGEWKMSWKVYFDYVFRSVGGRLIFHCNYDSKNCVVVHLCFT